ncbi:large-conductance mechanosensitive channel protein MscL [Acutalibacter sp. 1XD8-36]|uniref:large-conductance mechanosensitive channel protein MscL n=1 Tax=Acutalibacter sp. 1XD8-36 TaxID=2320852 RepID=UPI0014121715|nr:large-conductance mechanosensitive channel protein MscL [Acutalibacter sp. 1XD8-36]NBJ89825.1 large-conductance mechanosensitive channel protein MscL [Acutalibacter sp. 1XD8-36]
MKLLKEFREFISRGNVIDMAVGVIIGGAFTGIVNSLVNDLFMPLLGLLTGGMNFAALSVQIGPGEEDVLRYGAFIAAVINFLLIALVLFLLIKTINSLRRKKEEAPAPVSTKTCPYCKSEIHIDAARCPHCTSELQK